MSVTDQHGPAVPRIGAAAVDPRFRARRIAVRRDEGRRRLKRLLALVAVAAVALTAVIVLRSPVLDVDEVAVTGTTRLDAEAIRAAAGIGVGRPILLADLGGAEDAIEALPWVAAAEVERELPGTVRIAVREREPAAIVTGAGRSVLVDREGWVLDDAEAAVTGPFVHVDAPESPPAPGGAVPASLRTAVDLAGRLTANPAGAVAAVHTQGSLTLQLVEGGVVDLGDATELDAKVEAFRTVYARVDRTCLARIDLTVPTHPVLTRRPC